MILSRSYEQELMDDFSIEDQRIDRALQELAVINKWLGGHATSLKGVALISQNSDFKNSPTFLDVGSGGSDLVSALSFEFPQAQITALDINKRACEYARQLFPHLQVVHGSVFQLPFPDKSFDIVHVSLFLHHFTEEELHRIIPALLALARHGVIINDLRRSVFAFVGISILTRLFSRSEMVRNDGPLSVRRGFSRKEISRICALVPETNITIQRRWAFRWLVVIRHRFL